MILVRLYVVSIINTLLMDQENISREEFFLTIQPLQCKGAEYFSINIPRIGEFELWKIGFS